ncbi:protein-S-isoprenylcysteine O-methyltransferase A isoform X2 [Elaeis guineensis]
MRARVYGRARAPISRRNPSPSVASARAGGGIRVFPWGWKVEMAEIFLGYAAIRQLSQFFAALVFFHASEYALAIAIHGRSDVSVSSLLISKQYIVAMSCALLEYVIEIFLFPELKEYMWISNFGLVMVIVGELIRKGAVLTARHAFTHTIRTYHEDNHELITHGIYRNIMLFDCSLLASSGQVIFSYYVSIIIHNLNQKLSFFFFFLWWGLPFLTLFVF